MDKFPDRLRQLRKKLKLTQDELGEKINVTSSTISYYENGTKLPNAQTLRDLAEFLNVSIDYLVGRTDFTEQEQMFLSDVDYLTPEDLMSKYPLRIGDRDATEDEIKEMVDFIRAKRIMKMME